MNIGIISDTHDDLSILKNAIKIFNERKVEYVIHAGDYVFPGVVKEFRNLNGKLIGVLGNNDGEKLGLAKNFQEIGGVLHGEFCNLELDNLKIAIYHGTSNEMTEAIISSQLYDLIIHGHTHKKRDDKIRDVLVLIRAVHIETFQILMEKLKQSHQSSYLILQKFLINLLEYDFNNDILIGNLLT